MQCTGKQLPLVYLDVLIWSEEEQGTSAESK